MTDAHNLRAGFDRSLSPGNRPALLVVDFQRGFTEPGLSPLASDCSAAVSATAELIRAFRGLGPVIFSVIGYAPDLSDVGRWIDKCSALDTLIRGTPACELDPRLAHSPDDAVITKTQASAFFGTPLATMLAAARCDMLVVAGCTTSGCVRASVVDALQHGYPPFVVRDCVADRSPAQHESNLIDMHSKYGEVVGLDEMRAILASPERP